MVLASFNSTASFYKTLDSFDKRSGMSFDYDDFKLPSSSLQKTIAESKTLGDNIAMSLNRRSQVLMNVIKEIDDHSATIAINVKDKAYEADHLKMIYEHLERCSALISIWDDRKEELYWQVRKVFDSYPVSNKNDSWYLSANALQKLTDLNRSAILKSKTYYKGDTTIDFNTEKISAQLRDVIANEYVNMKGIEKLGRYNGLCPYTPYEDLPETSRTLVEKLQHLKPVDNRYGRHPYEGLVYLYNDIVEDHNKFSELSKKHYLLKTVYQPDLYFVKYPEEKTSLPASTTAQVKQSLNEPSKKNIVNPPSKTNDRVIRDTVYIEKRDTIYLTATDDNIRSMEGYAPNNLVLLLDVSGSMNAPEKLPLLKQSVLNLLNMMRQEDEISVVIFSGKANVLLKPVSFKESQKIRKAIDDLKSSGKTDVEAGIKLAFKVADVNYKRGGNNRIILATDGEFPISETMKNLISNSAAQDIYLTVFNFGKGAGSEKALKSLAAIGKGNYHAVSKENVELNLIREVKAKRKSK
jgi:Mg-chelatase subunit ChlD